MQKFVTQVLLIAFCLLQPKVPIAMDFRHKRRLRKVQRQEACGRQLKDIFEKGFVREIPQFIFQVSKDGMIVGHTRDLRRLEKLLDFGAEDEAFWAHVIVKRFLSKAVACAEQPLAGLVPQSK